MHEKAITPYCTLYLAFVSCLMLLTDKQREGQTDKETNQCHQKHDLHRGDNDWLEETKKYRNL